MHQAFKSMWALHMAALSNKFHPTRCIDDIQIAEPQGLREWWWQGLENAKTGGSGNPGLAVMSMC